MGFRFSMECQHHFDRAYIYLHTPCSLLAVKCVGGRCRWLLMLLLPCCKRGALCSVLKTVTSNYQYFLCNGLSYLSRESKYPACNKITMKTANLSPVCFFYVNESNNDQLSWTVGQLLVSARYPSRGWVQTRGRPRQNVAACSPPCQGACGQPLCNNRSFPWPSMFENIVYCLYCYIFLSL